MPFILKDRTASLHGVWRGIGQDRLDGAEPYADFQLGIEGPRSAGGICKCRRAPLEGRMATHFSGWMWLQATLVVPGNQLSAQRSHI